MATCCTRYFLIDRSVTRIILCQSTLSLTCQLPLSYYVMVTCCKKYSLTSWQVATIQCCHGHLLHKVLSHRLTSGHNHTIAWPPAAQVTLPQTCQCPGSNPAKDTCCTRYSLRLTSGQDHTLSWPPAAQDTLSQAGWWPGSYLVMATCCTQKSLEDWLVARIRLCHGNLINKVISNRLTSDQDHTPS